MTSTTTNPSTTTSTGRPVRRPFVAAGLVLLVLGACGGSSSSSPTPSPVVAKGSVAPNGAAGGPVLPVAGNPIADTSTNRVLTVENVLVENNVDHAGKAAADHLEITIANRSATAVSGIEVYYRFDDRNAGVSEGYYTKLPATFEIPGGGQRTVHFDGKSVLDHFPVNTFSLFATSKNALDVSVTVGAADAAIATGSAHKDAGGAEAAD